MTGPIELLAPKEPLQVEAQIKPVQVQLPKEDLHVTAAGIPEKITLAWEIKSIPLELHWPKDPLNISFDFKNPRAGSNDNELQKVIDTFSQLNRECKEQLSDLNRKLADAEQKEKQLQKTADSSNTQNNICNEKVTDLNAKLAEVNKQLAQEKDNHRKELEDLHKEGALSKQGYDKTRRKHGLPRRELWGSPYFIFVFLVMAGLLGGLSSSVVESLRERKERKEEFAKLKSILTLEADSAWSRSGSAPPAPLQQSDEELSREREMEREILRYRQRGVELDELLRQPWLRFEAVPGSLLGIVAALMVPAALHLWGIKLEAVSQNGYSLVTLCSFCFVCAMLGEPFIDGFLKFVSKWIDEVGKGSTSPQSESRDKKINAKQNTSVVRSGAVLALLVGLVVSIMGNETAVNVMAHYRAWIGPVIFLFALVFLLLKLR